MISLCLTTYKRTEMLFEAFRNVVENPFITEIVICDDQSDDQTYNDIAWYCKEFTKIKLYRNQTNLGCYHNKRNAVSKASNEWVILFDSDNIMTNEYIDKLLSIAEYWHQTTVIQPDFAKPHFDFTKYSGQFITRKNVHEYANDATFTTALNAMNYFVHRDEFLRVWKDHPEPWTADSLFMNYNWLNAGNSIYFCPGLQYEHRVHNGSHYKEHNRKTGNFYNEIVNNLKGLR